MEKEYQQTELELEETNMYILFARMFACIAREVGEKFGDEGIRAVREGVRQFGEARGRNIADRASAMGHEADLVTESEIEQDFDRCVFAETWMNDHTEEYGIHYCELIDPSIARGYNKQMECCHDEHFFDKGRCHFIFRMKDGEQETD